jgi:hypothetical protein
VTVGAVGLEATVVVVVVVVVVVEVGATVVVVVVVTGAATCSQRNLPLVATQRRVPALVTR